MKYLIALSLLFCASINAALVPIQPTSWTTNGPNAAILSSSGTISNSTLGGDTYTSGVFHFGKSGQSGPTAIENVHGAYTPEWDLTAAPPHDSDSTFWLGVGTIDDGGNSYFEESLFFATLGTIHDSDINSDIIEGNYYFGSFTISNGVDANLKNNFGWQAVNADHQGTFILAAAAQQDGEFRANLSAGYYFDGGGIMHGNGAGLTNILAADLPNTVVTNNNNGANAQVISGTNTFNGKVTVTNSLVVSGGTISGNGSGITNGFQNTFTKTNFLLATFFTNTSTRSIQVVGNARCNPTTTGHAIFRLLIDPTGSGTFSITNQAGLEADVIFTTAPHVWSTASGIVPPGGRYEFIDVSGDGLVTMTNSYFQSLQ